MNHHKDKVHAQYIHCQQVLVLLGKLHESIVTCLEAEYEACFEVHSEALGCEHEGSREENQMEG